MLQFLPFFMLSSVIISAQELKTCRTVSYGASPDGNCPTGYTRISNGNCCAVDQVITSPDLCEDKFSGCAVRKPYCKTRSRNFEAAMNSFCAKTCGRCKAGSASLPPIVL
ncbi:ShKT domain-containing protein [Caenorhabditis elegans]|uniref:ShKT domain-containing protein n=1 Tax=Caenorhabditis elegans TaxID=6239 RepID=Q22220_CAEEL|nr:ShKT domain-containing protein [Caenorhabditis elegans]CCD61748.2 ShKT domain-containing protein [Caenorhabditis elegans]